MNQIGKLRFDAIAGYARKPMSSLYGRELAYFDHPSGRVLGMHLFDLEDDEHFGMVFAQDSRLRYRSVGMTPFVADPDEALADLFSALDQAAAEPAEEHYQGDERGAPVDFFTPVKPAERLSPEFNILRAEEAYSPALGVIEPMMRWYEDADGNFVEQFQTTGFDQRMWELYLFAALVEQGFELNRSDAIPDFHCKGLSGELAIEAVTVGPTRKGGVILPLPPRATIKERRRFLMDYMPIKFGSALYSKLQKKYWLRESVVGKPFALAVADFVEPGSMASSASALETYLFGVEHITSRDNAGRLVITPRPIERHVWGDKSIASGFFNLPDAENVSAVISSSSGSMAKFNRMGLLAGFGTGRVLMVRDGTKVDHDPDASGPTVFRSIVNASGYHENWSEGMNVYHNPTALIPLDPAMFPNAAHHFLEDGRMRSFTPEDWPFGSSTRLFAPVDVGALLASVGDHTLMSWTMPPELSDQLTGEQMAR